MTVAELIVALQSLPPDLRVVVRGYERGVNDISKLEKKEIELDTNTAWYYGQHEEHYPGDESEHTVVEAVELVGRNNIVRE